MIEQILGFFQGTKMYVDLANVILSMLTSLAAGFGVGRLHIVRSRNRLKKILGFFSDGACQVVVANWRGNLEYSDAEKERYRNNSGCDVEEHKYIRFDEAQALLDVETVCEVAGFNSRVALIDPDASVTGKNVFICGGPLGNEYLKHIFIRNDTSEFSFERELRFGTHSAWFNRAENTSSKALQIEVPDERPRSIFVKKKSYDECGGKRDDVPSFDDYTEISVPDGYVVYIKKRMDDSAFFTCFGNSALSGSMGIKALKDKTNAVHKFVKKHPSHFFLVVRCNKNNQPCFDDKNVFDLTEKMFGCD